MAINFLNTAIGTSATFTGVVTMTDRLVLSDSLQNSFIGEDTGVSNTTGDENVGLGYNSLFSNTTGGHNTAIGKYSLYSNISGNYNIALGNQALYSSTTGSGNIGIGFLSLYTNSSGFGNVGLGERSLQKNTTGSSNNAIGVQAMWNNTTGGSNSATGYWSLYANTTGNGNAAFGNKSLVSNTTGSYNVAMGYAAGKWIADGSTPNATTENSIFIGRDTKANANGETNQIVIGNTAIGNGSNTVTLGNDNIVKTVLKGTITAPSYGAGTLVTDAAGNITASSGGGAGGPFLPLSATSSFPLTGGLFGTSAQFSGAVSTNNLIVKNTAPYMQWQIADGTRVAYIQHATDLVLNTDTGGMKFATVNTNRLRITNTGETWIGGSKTGSDIASGSTTYMNSLNAGGFSILHRNAADAYIHLNSYYTSTGTYIAKYGNKTGIRIDYTGDGNGLSFHKAPVVTSAGDTQSYSHVMSIGYGADNNVGIGTDNPGYKLDVSGGGIKLDGKSALTDSGYFVGSPSYGFRWNSSADTYNNVVMYDNGNMYVRGNVGIGTTSPLAALDIANTNTSIYQQWSYDNPGANNYNLQLTETVTSGNVRFVFDQKNAGTQYSDVLVFNQGKIGMGTDEPDGQLNISKTTSGITSALTLTNNQYAAADNTGSSIRFQGYSSFNPGSSNPRYSEIIGVNGGNSVPKRIDFKFTNDATITTPLSVLQTGNVGIGMTSPGAKLDVHNINGGNATTRAEMKAEAVLKLRPHATNSTNMLFSQVNNGAGMGITVTNGSATANWDIALNPYGGNVGIGTDNPDAKLEVYSSSYSLLRLKRSTVSDYDLQLGGAGEFYLYDNINSQYSLAIDNGNAGIGTDSPAAAAKLTVMGNQTFGLPGNGTNTSGRFISIEGNAQSNGEGSSRVFFTEHNSSTAGMDNYGMSLGYRGGDTSIVGASGNTWTGLTQIGNGEWGMFGHDNNAVGVKIMQGSRSATYTAFYSSGSETMRVTGGNVGIGETNPKSTLDVDGVIANGPASSDPNFTVAEVGNMGIYPGGSLQFTQGWGGTSSSGDTIVFRYNAATWKSWSLDYTLASTGGLVKGTIGGYTNNSINYNNSFLINNMNITAVGSNSGQAVIVTFTGNFGIHVMCDMRYSQGGGDGAPKSDRASLVFNS